MMQLLMLHPDLDQFSFSDAMGARPLSSEDASSLASLLNEAFEDGAWTSEQVHEKLLNASDILQVYGVVEHGAVVATASARQDESSFPGQGYVHMVATGLAARGRGLGRAVTEAVLARFAAEGLTEAVLETDDWRVPAVRTYLAMGFVPVIRDHTHYRRWSPVLQAAYRPVPASSASVVKDPR